MRRKQELDHAVPEVHLWVCILLCFGCPAFILPLFWGGEREARELDSFSLG